MRLRPVNAIFYEPKSKYIVIYQNGQLWQLPRMKIDIHSWRNRVTYKGEKKALYLNKEQKIHDDKLAKIVRTESFPDTLWHTTLPKFESWWRANGYEWSKTRTPVTRVPASSATSIETNTANNMANQPSQANSANQPVPNNNTTNATAKVEENTTINTKTPADKDVFDQLLTAWNTW